jgi:phage gpG-like protein
MSVRIILFGEEVAKLKLERGMSAVANMKPVLNLIADDMMRVIRTTITGQGRRFGGSWHALAPSTIQQKARKGSPDPRMLIDTGRMLEGYTVRDSPHQRLKVGPSTIILDTDLEYPEFIQHGTRKMPARPFIDFYPQDRQRWAAMVGEYLTAAMNL